MGENYHRCIRDKIDASPEDNMLLTSTSFWIQFSNWLKFSNLWLEQSTAGCLPSPRRRRSPSSPCGRRTWQALAWAGPCEGPGKWWLPGLCQGQRCWEEEDGGAAILLVTISEGLPGQQWGGCGVITVPTRDTPPRPYFWCGQAVRVG